MLDIPIGCLELSVDMLEKEIISFFVIYLVLRALCPRIDAKERDACAKLRIDAARRRTTPPMPNILHHAAVAPVNALH